MKMKTMYRLLCVAALLFVTSNVWAQTTSFTREELFGALENLFRAASTSSTCTCYYSYDQECPRGFVCDQDFSPIGCVRMKPKGGAWAGKCTMKDEQRQIRPCDGTCSQKSSGQSPCAGNDTGVIIQTMSLWLEAMTVPGLHGGGLIDAELAAKARGIALSDGCGEYLGWRTLAILEQCGRVVTNHSDPDHDTLEAHVLEDLTGEFCRLQAGNLCIAAVTRGLSEGPQAVDSTLGVISEMCPRGLPFTFAGPGYEGMDPLAAVSERLKVTVEYLGPSTFITTPSPKTPLPMTPSPAIPREPLKRGQ